MAVKAPKVQTVAQASKALNPAFAESKNVINQQISGLGAKYDAQRSGIYAERGEGFNTINDQATGRGASFAGIAQHEQARYLSTKFLPGLQQANFQQNDEGLKLQGIAADLNKQQYTAALSRVDQQQSALNSWNLQQVQLEASKREKELDRKFQAGENAKNRAASAANAARSAPATPTSAQAISNWATQINADGKNSNYKKNYSWENSGIGAKLKTDYGMSSKEAYQLRMQILGY